MSVVREDNIKVELTEYYFKTWTELIWMSIGTSVGISRWNNGLQSSYNFASNLIRFFKRLWLFEPALNSAMETDRFLIALKI